MKLRFYHFGLFIFFCVLPHSSTAYEKPTSVVMTHFEHPEIGQFIELIEQVYKDIGIEVQFHPVPSFRGFKLLGNQQVDADVLRMKINAASYTDLIIVEPAIIMGELSMLCTKGFACGMSALLDPDATIMSNMASQLIIDPSMVKANIVFNENLTDALKMLSQQKIDYLVFGTTTSQRRELTKYFEVVKLKSVLLNHVIHKKHLPLLRELQEAMIQRLNSFEHEDKIDI